MHGTSTFRGGQWKSISWPSFFFFLPNLLFQGGCLNGWYIVPCAMIYRWLFNRVHSVSSSYIIDGKWACGSIEDWHFALSLPCSARGNWPTCIVPNVSSVRYLSWISTMQTMKLQISKHEIRAVAISKVRNQEKEGKRPRNHWILTKYIINYGQKTQ